MTDLQFMNVFNFNLKESNAPENKRKTWYAHGFFHLVGEVFFPHSGILDVKQTSFC